MKKPASTQTPTALAAEQGLRAVWVRSDEPGQPLRMVWQPVAAQPARVAA